MAKVPRLLCQNIVSHFYGSVVNAGQEKRFHKSIFVGLESESAMLGNEFEIIRKKSKTIMTKPGILIALLGFSFIAQGRNYPMVRCGDDLTKQAPKIMAIESQIVGEGQKSELCGSQYPTLDLSQNDPFQDERYKEASEGLVPPFQACEQAYQEMMNRRQDCSTVAHKTFLVSRLEKTDPRWDANGFENAFSKIQDAINAASHCDHVVVRPGVYQEYLSIADKDVKVYSDIWDESGLVEDGNELAIDYMAEKIDLHHYYETGKRIVVERKAPYRKPLKRAVRTILQGGGYNEGPSLGGEIPDSHDPSNPNWGCGNRRPMVDFVAGTTRHTLLEGFSIRLMPEQDHMVPGHGHALQLRGGSPIIRHNLIYNNGSTGLGIHANFIKTTPFTPGCEAFPELEQQTYKNKDFTTANIQYRPIPLVEGNITYQNNGLGMGNNHYSCAVMVRNEAFWNSVPGEEATHNSPGIGSRHGAKTCIDMNVVYKNAWTGIGAHQGMLQPKEECAVDPLNCKSINERTRVIITRNIVFDNGHADTPAGFVGGIGVDGVGTPDEPAIISENISFNSMVTGIGVRNDFSGVSRGLLDDHTYAKVMNNVTFSNAMLGVACRSDNEGTTFCHMEGNESFWNYRVGLGFRGKVEGAILNNTAACNTLAGIQNIRVNGNQNTPIYNNIAYANVGAGIVAAGSQHGYNLMGANFGHPSECSELQIPYSFICRNQQLGMAMGGIEGEQDLFTDPLFMNSVAFDFRLQDNSPAIDSGRELREFGSILDVQGLGADRGGRER